MKMLSLAAITSLAILSTTATAGAQHDQMKSVDTPKKAPEKIPAMVTLKPAEGASVKIVSPRKDQTFKGDSIPLEFKLTQGKRGRHVHAYVDGELMGMFESAKGTLNGIKPGKHTLELRVVADDHKTELDATDKVSFTTK
jgi:Cu/Zn superoxide dismutase